MLKDTLNFVLIFLKVNYLRNSQGLLSDKVMNKQDNIRIYYNCYILLILVYLKSCPLNHLTQCEAKFVQQVKVKILRYYKLFKEER